VHELDDQVRVGAHDRDGGFLGGQGVEDLTKLQRPDRFGGVAQHLGEALLANRMVPSSAMASTGTGNRSSTTRAW
jgi:hypothetical protein